MKNLRYKFGIFKNGFTLAEVLITLVIVGVVAAFTISPLITKYQKTQTVSKIKKAYSTLAQVILRAKTDTSRPVEEWYEHVNYNALEYYNLFFKKYISTIRMCNGWSDCGYDSIQPFYSFSGTRAGMALAADVQDGRLYFYLADGTWVCVDTLNGGNKMSFVYLYVDINGGKKPNIFGKDVFVFKMDNTSGLVPDDNNIKKIMRDGWQIKDDYPW